MMDATRTEADLHEEPRLRIACSVGSVALLFFLCSLPSNVAWAQTTATGSRQAYPVKPIRLVVGFVAGGGTDRVSRLLARKLTDSFGQPIVVDNRAGSAGIIGAMIAAKAPPDGYTLFVGSISALATNVSMYSKLPYDPLRDFVPVTLTMMSPYLLVVNPSLPAATLKEFIAMAKAAPGKLNFASAGSGSGNHLAQEMFRYMASLDIVHVPYRGGGDQLTALIAGQVQASFNLVPTAMPQLRAGRLKALGVTSAQRVAILGDVPTIAETGVTGYEATSWQGVVAPAGTPRVIVDRLHSEIAKALQTPDVIEWLAAEGSTGGGIAPEAFSLHIKSEIVKWARVVKLSGAKAD